MVAPVWTAGAGTAYTASIYLNAESGRTVRMGIRSTDNYSTGAWLGSTTFTTTSELRRYSLPYTEASGGDRYLIVYSEISPGLTEAFSVDGAMVEVGSLTTYIDGDQEGCYWNGLAHRSQSVRSGQSRAGGSVVALADLGFTVAESPGIGMPPVENSLQSYAILPGAEFQRQRAKERVFTLTSYVSGTSRADLHVARKRIIDTLKIDAFTPQQPVRFWYAGGLGTVQIDAVYDAGLEFGNPDGFTENVSVRFLSVDPFWSSTTDEGTALSPRVNLGSVNNIAFRDPLGRWGTMGQSGSGPNNSVFSIAISPTGTPFIGGAFTRAGNTGNTPGVAMWLPATGNYGSLAGGTLVNTAVEALVFSPAGTLYGGGDFTLPTGTASKNLFQWNPNGFGSLTGGTAQTSVARPIRALGCGRAARSAH
jgi:hypothetical protein